MADMHPSRFPQLLRGASTAFFATLVALTAHLTGGGQLPGLMGLVAPFILSLMAATLLSGRHLSFVRLLIATGISQFLFHYLFVLGTPSVSAGDVPAMSAHHGHVMSVPFVVQPSMPEEAAGAAMWATHALSAVLTALGLYFSERILVTTLLILDRVRRWWRALHQPVRLPILRPYVSPLHVWVAATAALGRFAHSIARRGPPVFVCR